MLPGIILAAGDSTRMGSPKAALATPDGQTFVTRIVRTLREAGVTDLVDRHRQTSRRGGRCDRAAATHRPAAHRSQSRSITRSVVVAARRHGRRGDAIDRGRDDDARRCPARARVHGDRRHRGVARRAGADRASGHRRSARPSRSSSIARSSTSCDARPLDAGAKSVVRAHEAEIVNVPVDDEGCVRDVDTPADYEALRGEVICQSERRRRQRSHGDGGTEILI